MNIFVPENKIEFSSDMLENLKLSCPHLFMFNVDTWISADASYRTFFKWKNSLEKLWDLQKRLKEREVSLSELRKIISIEIRAIVTAMNHYGIWDNFYKVPKLLNDFQDLERLNQIAGIIWVKMWKVCWEFQSIIDQNQRYLWKTNL